MLIIYNINVILIKKNKGGSAMLNEMLGIFRKYYLKTATADFFETIFTFMCRPFLLIAG